MPAVAGIVYRHLERGRVGRRPGVTGGPLIRGDQGRHKACPYSTFEGKGGRSELQWLVVSEWTILRGWMRGLDTGFSITEVYENSPPIWNARVHRDGGVLQP